MVGYWGHVWRKFDEALNAFPPSQQEDTETLTGLNLYCYLFWVRSEAPKPAQAEDSWVE